MLPLFKVILVAGKLVAKPFVSQIKRMVQHNKGGSMYPLFVKWGIKIHRFEFRLNRKQLGLEGEGKVNQISDDKALDLFIGYFFEGFVLYGILSTIAYIELVKSIESSNKQKQDNMDLKSKQQEIQNNLEQTHIQIEQLIKQQQILQNQQMSINSSLEKLMLQNLISVSFSQPRQN